MFLVWLFISYLVVALMLIISLLTFDALIENLKFMLLSFKRKLYMYMSFES